MAFKKDNDDHEFTNEIMQTLARQIEETLSIFKERKGFCLIIFDFNKLGEANYVSNAKRKDMIKNLRSSADQLEKGEYIPPVLPGTH